MRVRRASKDAFARWRTAHGRPTRVLDLGPIIGAGYLQDSSRTPNSLLKLGLENVPVDHFLALLSYAISQPIEVVNNSQIAIGWPVGNHTEDKMDVSSRHTRAAIFEHLHLPSSSTPSKDANASDNIALKRCWPMHLVQRSSNHKP